MAHSDLPETRIDRLLANPTELEGLDSDTLRDLIAAKPKLEGLLRSAEIILASRNRAGTAFKNYRDSSESRGLDRLAEELGLEEQYKKALEVQRAFGLLKSGEAPPDYGRVLNVFTPEMLEAAKTFQSPKLVLVTMRRALDDLVKAMNGHKKIDGQNNVYVNPDLKGNRNWYEKKAEKWQAHLVEAPVEAETESFDDLRLVLRDRLSRFKDYKGKAGVRGVDRLRYAHLMMQALHKGRPIDIQNWTVLDEDISLLPESLVPVAFWDPDYREVGFGGNPAECPFDFARFRRSVGGDVE